MFLESRNTLRARQVQEAGGTKDAPVALPGVFHHVDQERHIPPVPTQEIEAIKASPG